MKITKEGVIKGTQLAGGIVVSIGVSTVIKEVVGNLVDTDNMSTFKKVAVAAAVICVTGAVTTVAKNEMNKSIEDLVELYDKSKELGEKLVTNNG